MEILINLIYEYGFDACVIAVIVNLSTSFAKIPIKHIAQKNKLDNKLNKYITLLPVVFGFIYSWLYHVAIIGRTFDGETIRLAVTAASLSLALYAILEKFFYKSTTSVVINVCEKNKEDDFYEAQSVEKENNTENVEPSIILGRKKNET
jgi:hypothetical protein